MTDLELITERLSAFEVKPGDMVAINAVADFQTWFAELQPDPAIMGLPEVAAFCNKLLAVADGILGDGATATIFAGMRPTIDELKIVIEAAIAKMQAANAPDEAALSDLTETVAED